MKLSTVLSLYQRTMNTLLRFRGNFSPSVLLLFASLAGCASAPPPVFAPAPHPQEIVQADNELEQTVQNAPSPHTKVDSHPHVLVEVNQNVKRWIHFFSRTDRDRFERFLRRGQPYKRMIQGILKEKGIPPEFYYLAMIESGFTINATSHASAKGIWQLMAGTSSRYGLKTNRHVDERLDPIRATVAASDYLLDLYNTFGSWHLAMAGYNAGEIRILRALMKSKTRDFWTLVEKRALPTETMDYVPKFLAAVIIGKNPKKYGFDLGAPATQYPWVEGVSVRPSISLERLARTAKLDTETLQTINPHLIRGTTPPGGKSYKVWIPKDSSPVVTRAKFAKQSVKPEKQTYRVRRGDTLQGISNRFGIPLARIKQMNKLRQNQINAGQVLTLASRDI